LRDAVADVGAIEAGNELARLLQREPFDDLAARRGIRRRGERDARHGGEAFVQHGQRAVLGAEVVAPLRDAMRLVDGEQGQPGRFLNLFQQGKEAGHQQAFRGDIEQVELAAQQAALHLACGIGADAGIEEGRLHAELGERIHLILHQRDQRRHHDARARPQQRGNLVAQRFAAAGRHQHQRVAARRDMLDDGLLFAAKGGIAEDIAQDLPWGGCHGRVNIMLGGGAWLIGVLARKMTLF